MSSFRLRPKTRSAHPGYAARRTVHVCGTRDIKIPTPSSDKLESGASAHMLQVPGRNGVRKRSIAHIKTTFQEAMSAGSLAGRCLQSNEKLLSAFLKLATQRKHRTVLKHLEQHLGDKEHDCSSGELTGVLQNLSTDSHERQEEEKALVVAAHAFREFTCTTLKCIMKMDADARDNIFKLVESIPDGSSMHVFADEAFPDSYLTYFQVLRKMGFGRSGRHLEFSRDCADALHAGIVALNIVLPQ